MKLNFPFIQVAGILSQKEAKMIASFENIYLGFPLVLDYHKEDLPKVDVKRIIKNLKIENRSILITYLKNAKAISELLDFLNISIVQIHSEIELTELIKLKEFNKYLLIKSLIIKQDNLTELINQVDLQYQYIDAFITDTYDSETGAKGATGKVNNWNISKKIIEYSKKPIIIAGGLNPDNIKDAILFNNPAGVDSHTGLEDEKGEKSLVKTKIFYDISMKYL